MPRPPLVPAAHWRRGRLATERVGAWLKEWEERGRCLREGLEPPPVKPRRRRRRPQSKS